MERSEKTYLFVYGTLRPPQPTLKLDAADTRYFPQIADGILRHEPATLQNATLYNIGTYPAIVEGAGQVYGDLLEIEPETLTIADRIENHPYGYKRYLTEVQTSAGSINAGSIKAWVYRATETMIANKPQIESGDWFRRTPDPVLASHIKRFAESKCSWLATVRTDNRAHCAPMWHVWYRGRIYLVAQPTSIKIENIAHSPNVTITHPDPSNVIIIDGVATEAPEMANAIQPLMLAKYEWNIATDAEYQTIIEITPLKLMAWNNSPIQRWQQNEILQIW